MVREVPQWECDDPSRSDSPHPGHIAPENKGVDRDPPESDTGLLNVWDAFDRNDDVAEPEPEYGDFWPELDDADDAH